MESEGVSRRGYAAEEVPVFGVNGEQGAEGLAAGDVLAGGHFVDIEGGEVALGGGGDVEAEAEGGRGA
jgi:hypothetical protein